MAEIKRGTDGTELSLEQVEIDLLRGLLDELQAGIESEQALDQAVADRLFPRAYADEKDAAAFDELVGGELRTQKLEAIDAMRAKLGSSITIAREDLDVWLPVLTDLRLALGTRLNVDEDTMERELDPDDPDAGSLAVLHWLGWMQESLLDPQTPREES